jgi:hypothetical protein
MDDTFGICLDCTAGLTNHACIYRVPLEAWVCGCSSSNDCAGGQTCQSGSCVGIPESCTNNVDDDLDGLTDCADTSDCPEHTNCGAGIRHCEAGACVFCSLDCNSQFDCAGCGNFTYCDLSANCCASGPGQPCP